VHDFGSILAFIEYNFLGSSGIGTIGGPNYPFADYYAPDWYSGNIPLQEFFLGSYSNFTPIPVPVPFGPSFFTNYQGKPEDGED
jgi:hypothetical protein